MTIPAVHGCIHPGSIPGGGFPGKTGYKRKGQTMGTINFATSNYITMGTRIMHVDDLLNDSDYVSEYGNNTDDAYSYINQCYDDDYSNIENLLKDHSFYYYHVAIKPGYYEGFHLDIENNFPVAYDSWEDRRDAQKEITEIKRFLYDCAGCGLAAVYPGWCTTEFNYIDTLKHIDSAIKEMREEVKTIPTWRQYERG